MYKTRFPIRMLSRSQATKHRPQVPCSNLFLLSGKEKRGASVRRQRRPSETAGQCTGVGLPGWLERPQTWVARAPGKSRRGPRFGRLGFGRSRNARMCIQTTHGAPRTHAMPCQSFIIRARSSSATQPPISTFQTPGRDRHDDLQGLTHSPWPWRSHRTSWR